MENPVLPSSCVTPAGTSIEVQNEWEENTHTHMVMQRQHPLLLELPFVVVVIVVVDDSHIQRIVLATTTEETMVTQQVGHRPIKCKSRFFVVTKRYEGQRVTSW